MTVELYGIAYSSPILIWQLVSQRKYNPIMLVNNSIGQLKQEAETQMKKSQKLPVILAGSLDIAHAFLKTFPKQECKIVLFDCPGLLNPCVGPLMRWLDCDHQAAGAWQVAKIKPEDFMDILDALPPLTVEGKKFLMSMQRHGNKDRLEEIRKFSESIPKYYKDLLASMESEYNKSPIKALKETRKIKDGLKTLLAATIETVPEVNRSELTKLVLDYQITLVGKREYLSKLNQLIVDETVRKDFLTLRKWMDSKNGALLQDAFFDYGTNYTRRSWQTVMDAHKKVADEDLMLLITHFDVKNTMQVFADKTLSYQNLPADKVSPKEPNHP